MQVKGVFFGVAIVAAFSVGFGKEGESKPFTPITPDTKNNTKTSFNVTSNEDSNLSSQEKHSAMPESGTDPKTSAMPESGKDPEIFNNVTTPVKPKETNQTVPQEDEKTKSTSEGERKKTSFEAISIKLLEAEENGIEYSDMASKRQVNLKNITNMKVFSVDFHWKKKLIFYAANDTIFREQYASRFSTENTEIVEDKDVDGPVSITVDWVHDQLYWLSIRHNTVECSSLNGTDRTLLIDNLVNTLYPNNIAVDPYEGYIFFVSNHTIFKATLDAKYLAAVQLNGTEGRAVKHVAVDPQRKRLFYAGKDGNFNTGLPYIASCDYEGQHVRGIPLANVWNDIYSLSVFRNILYFTHYPKVGGDTVWSVYLTDETLNPNIVYTTRGHEGGVWSIKVFHPEVQQKL